MLKDAICGFCYERHDCFILGNGYCGKRERLTATILTTIRECKTVAEVLAKLEGK